VEFLRRRTDFGRGGGEAVDQQDPGWAAFPKKVIAFKLGVA
jgi:hypothetical protein